MEWSAQKIRRRPADRGQRGDDDWVELIDNTPTGSGSSKSGSVRKPFIAQDTLSSTQTGRIVDLLGEGVFEGPTHGDIYKDAYLDGVLATNFRDVKLYFRDGSPDQAVIPGFPAAEFPQSINVLCKIHVQQVRSVILPADALRIGLSTDALIYINHENGDQLGWHFDYRIGIRPFGAGGGPTDGIKWHQVKSLKGKTRSRYSWDNRIVLAEYTPAQYPLDVIVEKTYPSDTDSNPDYHNQLFWDLLTIIQEVKLSYPYSALCGVEVDASLFNAIPATAYDMLLQRVRVPVNYRPWSWERVTHAAYETDGKPWDGSFKWAWTDNPAWIAFDLLTQERFSLGRYVQDWMADKWTLYSIARNCDEAVDDGEGGLEPRFACNTFIQQDAEAYTVLRDFASIFRGMVFWCNGGIQFSQDVEGRQAIHQFNPSNIIGEFSYSGTARRARHTACVTRYTTQQNFFQPAIVYSEDREAKARYGYNLLEQTAFACTSRGQAMRSTKYALVTEREERETCSWRTGFEGMPIRPGDLCENLDPDRGGKRWGGRVIDAQTNKITIDAPVDLPSGVTCKLAISMPDLSLIFALRNDIASFQLTDEPAGASPKVVEVWADWNSGHGGGGFAAPFGPYDALNPPMTVQCVVSEYDATTKVLRIEPLPGDGNSTINFRVKYPLGMMKRNVTTSPGTTSVLAFTPNLPVAPEPMSLWLLSEPNQETRKWRVLNVEEDKDGNFEIGALEFADWKFAEIESDIVFTEPPPGYVPPENTLQIAPPTGLTFTPELIVTQYASEVSLNVDWLPSPSLHVSGYLMQYRYENDPWIVEPVMQESNFGIRHAKQGHYEVKITAQSVFGQTSTELTGTYELGETTIVQNANITGLQGVGIGQGDTIETSDFAIEWRLNAPHIQGAELNDPLNNSAGSAGLFPYFRDYEIRVFDPDVQSDGVPLRVAHTLDRTYTYHIAENREDGFFDSDGVTRIPRRKLRFEVAVRDLFNRASTYSRLTLQNRAPGLPSEVDIFTGVGTVWMGYRPPPDIDGQGLRMWASLLPNVVDDVANLNDTTLVFTGDGNPAVFDWTPETDCHFRYGYFDSFDKSPETLNLSGSVTVHPGTFNSDPNDWPDGSIPGTKIQVATIDRARIKDGEIVNAHIQNEAVDRTKIKLADITAAQIALATITNAQLASATILAANIKTAEIDTAWIKDLAIGTNKLKAFAATVLYTGIVSHDGWAGNGGADNQQVWKSMATIALTGQSGVPIVIMWGCEDSYVYPSVRLVKDGVVTHTFSISPAVSGSIFGSSGGNGSNMIIAVDPDPGTSQRIYELQGRSIHFTGDAYPNGHGEVWDSLMVIQELKK